MKSRRFEMIGLLSLSLMNLSPQAWAHDVPLAESPPSVRAVFDGRNVEFFLRFDRPVDHVHSRIAIMRDGKVVKMLNPRLEAQPDVLFARAATLSPGDYKLYWLVRSKEGTDLVQGGVPFTVSE